MALTGCVRALQAYNLPSQEHLLVQGPATGLYSIQIDDQTQYPVSTSGQVTVDIPRLRRGCSTYLFGVLKIRDGSPYNLPVISLKKGTNTVRKLSLNDLAKLPVDTNGWRIIAIPGRP